MQETKEDTRVAPPSPCVVGQDLAQRGQPGAVTAAERTEEEDALLQMFHGWDRLRRLGWKEIMYCPKDGTHFQAIEAGSTGIHDANYEGTWPDGHWWVFDGDMWPSRPILFKLYERGQP